MPSNFSDSQELTPLIILNNVPGLGPIRISQLIDTFGSAAAVLEAPLEELLNLSFLPKSVSQQIFQWKELSNFWEKDLELIQRMQIKLIPYYSPEYPARFRQIKAAPVLLYILGDPKIFSLPTVGIIGTRQATLYGRLMAERFAKALAQAGINVVSGLARGIDTFAHSTVLNIPEGKTTAFLGSGLGQVYPIENQNLASLIASRGVLASEFPVNLPADRQQFPQRNRLISGLSDVLLLIEAPCKSGAMITMEIGQQQGKKLFAIPGRLDEENFSGNHTLIQNKIAQLIQSPEEIIQILCPTTSSPLDLPLLFPGKPPGKNRQETPKRVWNLPDHLKTPYEHLPHQEFSIEYLITKPYFGKQSIDKILSLLSEMELYSLVESIPGNIYVRINR